MIVVSNASPLIGLSAIGKVDLLESLYQKIYVPEDVYEEITGRGAARIGAKEIKNAGWIERRKVESRKIDFVSINAGLGQGESASLVLAEELRADLLIIDDLRARKFAQSRNLPIIGILGVLLAAKSQNLIGDIKNSLDSLIVFGYWVSPNLYQKILEAAGE